MEWEVKEAVERAVGGTIPGVSVCVWRWRWRSGWSRRAGVAGGRGRSTAAGWLGGRAWVSVASRVRVGQQQSPQFVVNRWQSTAAHSPFLPGEREKKREREKKLEREELMLRG